MPFVADAPPTGRFVPDDEVMKGVKSAPKADKPEKSSFATPPGEAFKPPVALAEALASMGTGMVAKPVADVMGMAATGADALRGSQGDPAAFRRHIQESLTYQPRTQAGRKIAEYNPLSLISKALNWTGEKAEQIAAPPDKSGPVRAAVGYGLKEAVPQAINLAAGKYGPPAVEAIGDRLKEGGRNWMRSALKPSAEAQRTGKSDVAVETLLKEGANVSKGGVDKLRDRLNTLDDRLDSIIDKAPGTIDKQHVGYYVQSAIDKFKNQVDKAKDVRAAQKVWDRFLNDFDIPDKIPVRQAQDLKRGTYKALGEKAYGELKGSEIEANKALARGLKDEIARVVPEVQPLNAEMSKLSSALSLTEKRALMEANKNPAGLAWLTTSPTKWAAYMADRSGLFKSIVARMLYSGGETMGPGGVPFAAPAAAVMQGQIGAPPRTAPPQQ